MSVSQKNRDLIRFEGVTKKYRDLLALDNVSFSIHEGEVFGYIGPNGAGKTTTIKIMVGLLRQSQGILSIGGHSMPDQKDEVHKLVGYLPQQVAFQEWRTVNHALTTFGRLSGVRKEEIDSRIKEILEFLNLSDVRHKKIVELSGGMTQKVGLAQALLHHPKLLILDEPLTGLDPTSRIQVKQIITELSKNGTTVFFSSHILSDVQDIATKIGILNWGHIMNIGNLDELKSHFTTKKEIKIVLSHDSRHTKELKSLEGIQAVERLEQNTFLVTFDNAVDMDEAIHRLMTQMLALNYRIRSIAPVSPSLDDVYLQYVGGGKKL